MKSHIVSYEGVTFDLSQVKSFQVSNSKDHTLVIEYKKRIEYIFNPTTTKHEKEEFNDTIEVDCGDIDSTYGQLKNFTKLWQDYLNSQV